MKYLNALTGYLTKPPAELGLCMEQEETSRCTSVRELNAGVPFPENNGLKTYLLVESNSFLIFQARVLRGNCLGKTVCVFPAVTFVQLQQNVFQYSSCLISILCNCLGSIHMGDKYTLRFPAARICGFLRLK